MDPVDDTLREIGAKCDQVPFAINAQGRVVHAAEDSVVRGRKCNCTCPSCGHAVVAKKGQIRPKHFAHLSGAACRGARESALHKAAKQILEDYSTIQLPALTIEPIPNQFWHLWLEGWFHYNKVETEVTIDKFRPDIVISGHQGEILVEIYVTHRCTAEKIQWARDSRRSMIEIDLHKLPWLPSWDELKKVIQEHTDLKQWVNLPAFTEIITKIGAALCVPPQPAPSDIHSLVSCPLGDITGWRQVPLGKACNRCDFRASEWLMAQVPGLADAGPVVCLANTGVSCVADWRNAREAGWVFQRNNRGLPKHYRSPPPEPIAISVIHSPSPEPVVLPIARAPAPSVPSPPAGANEDEWNRDFLGLVRDGNSPAEAEKWLRRLSKYAPKTSGQPALPGTGQTCNVCGAMMVATLRHLSGNALWVCREDVNHPRRWAPEPRMRPTGDLLDGS